MIALVIFLMLALLAIGGVAAYLYVRQKELERQALKGLLGPERLGFYRAFLPVSRAVRVRL